MIILEIKFLNYYNLGNRVLEEMVRKSGVVLMLHLAILESFPFCFSGGFYSGFLNYNNFGNKVPELL
jgi:hypothetical protein